MNERIEQFDQPRVEVLCECASKECVELIALSRDEYEEVRRTPTHFFVVAGHQLPEIERTVERTDRYVVVEKYGDAGTIAVRLDPRRRQRPSPRHTGNE